MTASTFLRDIVVPAATGLTALSCAALTVLLFLKGEVGGGISTLSLTAAITLFVIHDVKRLILK